MSQQTTETTATVIPPTGGAATAATASANTPADPPAGGQQQTATEPAGGTATAATEQIPGEEALGDPGKQALDRMKAERNQAQRELAEAKQREAALQAKIDGREQEFAAEQEKQRLREEGLSQAKTQVLKASLLAAAAGKLADPNDALAYIDVSTFEVNDDFTTDGAALLGAVNDLITRKPYLAAQGGSGFTGSVDQGTRNGEPLSIDEQIKQAEAKGDFRTAGVLKSQKLLDLS